MLVSKMFLWSFINKMWKILKRDFFDHRISTIISCGIGFGFLLLFVAIFPSIQHQAQAVTQTVEQFKGSFLKAFGIESLDFNNLATYLAYEQFSITWQVLVILLVISRSGNALSGEIERKTMGFLLAQPVTRLQLFFGKYFSSLASLILFVIASVPTAIILAQLFSLSFNNISSLKLTLLCLMFGWAVMALGFLFSALFSERGYVYMVVGGIVFIMYILNIVANILDRLHSLSYVSLFHYFQANNALLRGSFVGHSLILFAAVIVVATALGAFIFTRRDITV